MHDPSDGTSLGYLQMASTNGLDILPQAVSRKTQIEVQVLTKVLKVIFQKSGTHFRDNIRYFDVISAAISMKIRSGLDQNGPRDMEIN